MISQNSQNEYNSTDFTKIKGGVYPLIMNDITFLAKYVVGKDIHDNPSNYVTNLKSEIASQLADTFARDTAVSELGVDGQAISSQTIPMYSFSGDVKNVTYLKSRPSADFVALLDYSQINVDNTSFDYTLIFNVGDITTTRKLNALILISNSPQTVLFTEHCNVDTITGAGAIAVNVKKTSLGALIDIQKLLVVVQS